MVRRSLWYVEGVVVAGRVLLSEREACAAPTWGSFYGEGGAGGYGTDSGAKMARRVHRPHWLVGSEARVGTGHLVAEPLLPVGHAVGKDHADGPV